MTLRCERRRADAASPRRCSDERRSQNRFEFVDTANAILIGREPRVIGEFGLLEDIGAQGDPLGVVLHRDENLSAVGQRVDPIGRDHCVAMPGARRKARTATDSAVGGRSGPPARVSSIESSITAPSRHVATVERRKDRGEGVHRRRDVGSGEPNLAGLRTPGGPSADRTGLGLNREVVGLVAGARSTEPVAGNTTRDRGGSDVRIPDGQAIPLARLQQVRGSG